MRASAQISQFVSNIQTKNSWSGMNQIAHEILLHQMNPIDGLSNNTPPKSRSKSNFLVLTYEHFNGPSL